MRDEKTADIIKEIILHRRSVRFFTDKPISKEDLDDLITAGIYAPSGSNWQNQRFLIVTDKDEIVRIGKVRHVFPWITKGNSSTREKKPAGILGDAAALIFVFADAIENDRRNNGEYHVWEALEMQNTSASIQNILLLATAKGIGTCWVSASDGMNFSRLFSGKSWRSLLANYSIPNSYKLHGIIICGYHRKSDEEGYPKGEVKHGATLWQETGRQPLDYYTISSDVPRRDDFTLGGMDKFWVKTLVVIAKIFSRLLHAVDRRISAIEIRPFTGEKRR
jgi:nitroreductase